MGRNNKGGKGEALLIQRIREGEEYAYEIAFLKYHTPLCRYIWKYVRSEELAKEIVQEAFADVWEDRENLNPSGHLRGLLYEIARNKALDYIKHQKVVNEYISKEKSKKKKNISVPAHFEGEVNQELFEDIQESLKQLPPRGRQIFELNRNEGLTYIEISEYLDISVKTVETHMRRALQKLRNSLSKYLTSAVWVLLLMELYFCSST